MKIKNEEIHNLFIRSVSNIPREEKGIYKLVNSNKINVVLSYKLSLIYKKIGGQFDIIEQQRIKIIEKYTSKKGEQETQKILDEFKLIQDEEFEIGEKLDINLNDLKSVGLTPFEFNLLSCILNYIKT